MVTNNKAGKVMEISWSWSPGLILNTGTFSCWKEKRCTNMQWLKAAAVKLLCSRLQTKCRGGVDSIIQAPAYWPPKLFWGEEVCRIDKTRPLKPGRLIRMNLKTKVGLACVSCSLTWVGHCYCVVGTVGAHIIDDNCRGVEICDVPDFLLEGAVPRGNQRHPGGALGHSGEPDVWVARLSVLQKWRHQDQTLDFFLGRVLAVPTALGFLHPDLRADRIQVRDVDKRRVPFLLFCNSEVQAQQVNETKWQQPRRESQTAARSDDGWCHRGRAAGRRLAMSSESAPQCRPISLLRLHWRVKTCSFHTIRQCSLTKCPAFGCYRGNQLRTTCKGRASCVVALCWLFPVLGQDWLHSRDHVIRAGPETAGGSVARKDG